jgi:hypothetical protein
LVDGTREALPTDTTGRAREVSTLNDIEIYGYDNPPKVGATVWYRLSATSRTWRQAKVLGVDSTQWWVTLLIGPDRLEATDVVLVKVGDCAVYTDD